MNWDEREHMQPLKRCNKVGCKTLISYAESYCDKHKNDTAKRYDKMRYKTRVDYMKFYNTKDWKQARLQQLTRQPLCEMCLLNGITTQATVVHHIKDTKTNWDDRLTESNLESICKPCHESISKGRW